MRANHLAYLFLFLLPAVAPPAQAQKKKADDVRDAFLFSRVKVAAEKPGQPARAAPGRSRKPIVKTNAPIGVGYTVYLRDEHGAPARVPEAREFHQGDAVRLIVESNVDGYLYIFHTENDGPPRMIFPDARLNEGRNHIAAHTPYEVPSRREPNPKWRWLIFDEKAATERLYLVVSKNPLAGAPTGKELAAYCQANAGGCPWRPDEKAWTLIATNTTATREARSEEFGQALTEAEREAVERGFGLGLDAPAPAVIRISASRRATQLVATVALVHK